MSRTLQFFLISSISTSILATPALAHSGHIGELAGHGHLIGWGLLIGAGIAAAAIAKLSGKKRDEEDADTPEDEIEGETA